MFSLPTFVSTSVVYEWMVTIFCETSGGFKEAVCHIFIQVYNGSKITKIYAPRIKEITDDKMSDKKVMA